MPLPNKPTDLFVTNGWYLELPGLVSPHFETLEGVQKTSQSVEIVDAGTNNKYRFPGQIMDYGEMTLTRTAQGTPDDLTLDAMVDAMIRQGIKVNAVAVKLHHGVEVFRILFEGFRIAGVTYPSFDVNAEEKFTLNYTATCDSWTKL